MKILLHGDLDVAERSLWLAALRSAWPEATWLDAQALPPSVRPEEISVAVVANPPPGALAALPGLALIHSLWAGVERLLADPALPPTVPIVRMVDPAMTAAMAETALWAVLMLHRGFHAYARRQRAGVWRQHAQRRADEVPVLVLGHGHLGQAVAARLAAQGYPVTAWRRGGPASHATLTPGVRLVDGEPGLAQARSRAAIVVNLLPLTDDTRGLVDAGFLAALPPGAALVNLARGAHVVDDDLLAALDAGHLGHAVLDVYATEPLPAGHRYWSHPAVTMLPHAAALTDPRSASRVVAANLQAWQRGEPVGPQVDRRRGY